MSNGAAGRAFSGLRCIGVVQGQRSGARVEVTSAPSGHGLLRAPSLRCEETPFPFCKSRSGRTRVAEPHDLACEGSEGGLRARCWGRPRV